MVRKFLAFIAGACLLVAAGASFAQQGPTEILMFAGEVRTLPVAKVKRVAVGNGSVVTTTVLNDNELLLIADKPGETSLVVWDASRRAAQYMVRVGNGDVRSTLQNANLLLGDIPGVNIAQVGTNVVVSGSVSQENLGRIAAAAKLFPQISVLAKEEEVAMRRMVYMKVQIVEMKRSLSQSLGLNWQAFGGATAGIVTGLGGNPGILDTANGFKGFNTTTSTKGAQNYLGLSTMIQSTLNLARNNGDAFVLAEPELSSRSGGAAKLLVGGQIPLPSTSSFGAGSVEFKDYGIKLTIKPSADEKGNIRAQVSTEISSIDKSTAVNNIPGFLTRSSESEVNMRSGQTLVMSGIVSADMSKDVSMIPGLGNVPVLGQLFRSDGFLSGRTDLVILITPNVYDPNSTLNRERVEKGMEIRKRFERELSAKDIVD